MTDLKALREVAEKATPGPWEAFEDSNEHLADCPPTMEWLVSATDPVTGFSEEIIGWGNGGKREDAMFVARFNPKQVLELLDRLEQSDATIERVQKLHVREVVAVHEGHGEEAWCPECEVHWPCPTMKAIEAPNEGLF